MLRTTAIPAKLTKRERSFLDKQGIPSRWVVDVSGLPTISDCYWYMVGTSTCLAVGFGRCEQGHRLMNRRGKCVQCDPRLLMRTRRWIRHGYVYLAESPSLKLIKLGSCQDLAERHRTLNAEGYAGAYDWRLRIYHSTIAAEMFEHDVRRRLAPHQLDTTYFRYGRETRAQEVYRCTYRTAKKHLEAELAESFSHYLTIAGDCLIDEQGG
jgi:hypothetical protein